MSFGCKNLEDLDPFSRFDPLEATETLVLSTIETDRTNGTYVLTIETDRTNGIYVLTIETDRTNSTYVLVSEKQLESIITPKEIFYMDDEDEEWRLENEPMKNIFEISCSFVIRINKFHIILTCSFICINNLRIILSF